MPNMTVQVFFVLGEAKGVPIASLAALEPKKGSRGSYTATVVTDDGQEKRDVKVGLATRTEAQVVSGIAGRRSACSWPRPPRRRLTSPRGGRVPGMGGPRL